MYRMDATGLPAEPRFAGSVTDMNLVRIGLIGCGGNMRWHISELQKLDRVEIVALADPDPAQIQRTQSQYPRLKEVPVFADYRDLLNEPLDAVSISTPHTQHRAQVEDSFAKGLHVMIEKPLCTTIADSEAAIQARDRAGKVGFLSYQRHVTAEYVHLRNEILAERLGKVQMVSAMLMQGWKRATTGSWRQEPELSGGGMFLDSGSHMVDALIWMTGLEPESVSAQIDSRGTPVDINAAVSFQAKNGISGTITICGDSPGWHEEITIFCERGAYFLNNGKLSVTSDTGKLTYDHLHGSTSPDAAFVAAIRGEREVPASFEDGLRVMKLTQAAYDSAASGGAVVRV
jgi:predicted dehydrogenase